MTAAAKQVLRSAQDDGVRYFGFDRLSHLSAGLYFGFGRLSHHFLRGWDDVLTEEEQ